jgi:hypothetical protein
MSKSLNSLGDLQSTNSQSPRKIMRGLLDSMPRSQSSKSVTGSSTSAKNIIKSYVTFTTPKKSNPRPLLPDDLVSTPTSIPGSINSDEDIVIRTAPSRKQMLLSTMRKTKYNSPRKKEIEEAYAFANTARNYYGVDGFDVVIDVAGGHGALAALLLMSTSAKEAVVVDPAVCASGVKGVEAGWGHLYSNKILRYRNEDLESSLADEIRSMRAKYSIASDRILVVACHACQYLTTDTLAIARSEGVNVCVMPCCQKDTTGGSMKAFAKSLNLDIGIVMDIMAAGEMSNYYTVRLKLVDASITPQNRMIMCRVIKDGRKPEDARSKSRLKSAYTAAHRLDTSVVAQEILEYGKERNYGVNFGIHGAGSSGDATTAISWRFVFLTSAVSAVSGALLATIYVKYASNCGSSMKFSAILEKSVVGCMISTD